jgi:hypothetical protein
MSPLAPVSNILVDLVNLDSNFVPSGVRIETQIRTGKAKVDPVPVPDPDQTSASLDQVRHSTSHLVTNVNVYNTYSLNVL